MARRKTDPEEVARLRDRVNSLFDQAATVAGFGDGDGAPGTWTPTADLLETETAYQVTAELPGVEAEDVRVEIRGSRLEISGVRRSSPEKRQLLQMERSTGPFRRSFELPAGGDGQAMAQRFDSGVLSLEIPKLAPEGRDD